MVEGLIHHVDGSRITIETLIHEFDIIARVHVELLCRDTPTEDDTNNYRYK
jgi:hypothetical protein